MKARTGFHLIQSQFNDLLILFVSFVDILKQLLIKLLNLQL